MLQPVEVVKSLLNNVDLLPNESLVLRSVPVLHNRNKHLALLSAVGTAKFSHSGCFILFIRINGFVVLSFIDAAVFVDVVSA